MLVAVTDHAAERFRQRVGGALDAKAAIIARVRRAVDAGRTSDDPPPGATGARGSLYVHDAVDRSVVYVCRRDGDELVVVTLWEQEGGVTPPRVPRRYTDALERRRRRRGGGGGEGSGDDDGEGGGDDGEGRDGDGEGGGDDDRSGDDKGGEGGES